MKIPETAYIFLYINILYSVSTIVVTLKALYILCRMFHISQFVCMWSLTIFRC